MAVYIVDSNFFIQAHRSYYPMDVFVSFWNKVKELAESGHIISIDKVRDEIFGDGDTLEDWCSKNLPGNFFHSSDSCLKEYAKLMRWANSQHDHYLPKAISEFSSSSVADAFLVAYALADNKKRILVTYESSQPGIKKKIKIPEACNEHEVKYIDSMTLLRNLRITL